METDQWGLCHTSACRVFNYIAHYVNSQLLDITEGDVTMQDMTLFHANGSRKRYTPSHMKRLLAETVQDNKAGPRRRGGGAGGGGEG